MKKDHLWVYIAENSDLIEDGQRPNCRFKKNKYHKNWKYDWTIDKL